MASMGGAWGKHLHKVCTDELFREVSELLESVMGCTVFMGGERDKTGGFGATRP